MSKSLIRFDFSNASTDGKERSRFWSGIRLVTLEGIVRVVGIQCEKILSLLVRVHVHEE